MFHVSITENHLKTKLKNEKHAIQKREERISNIYLFFQFPDSASLSSGSNHQSRISIAFAMN